MKKEVVASGRSGKRSLANALKLFDVAVNSWLGEFVGYSFYSDVTPAVPPEFPMLSTFVGKELEQFSYGVYGMSKVEMLAEDLYTISNKIIRQVKENSSKPEKSEIKELMETFEKLHLIVSDIQKTITSDSSYVDPETGIKNQNAFYLEINEDMSRMSRGDKGFAMILVHIDQYSQIRHATSDMDFLELLKTLSEVLMSSIRVHDDCYKLENNDFVVMSRITDVHGGVIVANRIINLMQDKKVLVNTGADSRGYMSCSCVVSQPEKGQNVEETIASMGQDLEKAPEIGCVIVYHEKTKIEKFIEDTDSNIPDVFRVEEHG